MTVRTVLRRVAQLFLIFVLLAALAPAASLVETLHFVLTAAARTTTEFAGYETVRSESRPSARTGAPPGRTLITTTLYPTFWYAFGDGPRKVVRNPSAHLFRRFDPGDRVEILIPARPGARPRLADFRSLYLGDLVFLGVALGLCWILWRVARALGRRPGATTSPPPPGGAPRAADPGAEAASRHLRGMLDRSVDPGTGRALGLATKVLGVFVVLAVAGGIYAFVQMRGDEAMLAAMASGDREAALELARAGRGVSARDDDGNSVLLQALARGDRELAVAIVEGGAWLKETRTHGETPLSLAARADDVALVELLVASGADPRQDPGPAIVHAIVNGNMALVRYLIDAGVNLDRGYAKGFTAGDTAVREGNREAAELIARHGGRFTVSRPAR